MRLSNLRWWIAGLLAAATALNYLDRQSLPVVITEVQKTIPITDQQYANLQMLFLLAYGVMYAGGGRIMDWLGTRLGYAIMIIWWSAATLLHGLVSSALGLGAARFLLGLGEGGGFPGSAKAVSEWFPPKERSFAFGIFNTGSSVGAVIAPPLIAAVVLWLGWRWVFFLTGAAGLLWAVIWLVVYDLPGRHKLITAAERDYLESSRPLGGFVDEGPGPRWIELFRFGKSGDCSARNSFPIAPGTFSFSGFPSTLATSAASTLRKSVTTRGSPMLSPAPAVLSAAGCRAF